MSEHDITQSVLDRMTHTWVLGPTGTGKTTLLAGMALHDIAVGHGAVVVDAGGALIARILERIPDHRLVRQPPFAS
jgi:ABC-type lipoprotein export system ATPase subunit